MTPYIIGYLTIGVLFTAWMRREFDWVVDITPAKKALSVLTTTLLWWLVILCMALDI